MPIYFAKNIWVNLILGFKMQKFNNFIKKMNQKQKIIFGTVFSIATFIVGYGIARNMTCCPFNHVNKSWFPLLITTIIIGFIWYKLLEEDNE